MINEPINIFKGSIMKISSISARPVLAPMQRPIRTAVGEIPRAPLVLIDIESDQGITGRAYIFAYTPLTLKPLVSFIENLNEVVEGWEYAPYEVYQKLRQTFRLLGSQGLVGMALCGIEMALWDGLGKSLDQPIATLLGGETKPIPAYDSFGVIDLDEDIPALEASLANGFEGIKIKIGAGDLRDDLKTVSTVREVIGSQTRLMIDYNQSLSATEAVSRLQHLKEYDISWVEEPVQAEDLQGHAHVSKKTGVPVQTGENWWFPSDMNDAIKANACDFAMLDLMKIGGVSGWMQASALAEAHSLPISSHLFVEASVHCLALTPTCHWLEWLDIASAVLTDPLLITNGKAIATGPGLGISWNEDAVEKHLY